MRMLGAIMIAGALGAGARYGLDGAVSARSSGAFPTGTFVVNLTGAFALGLLYTVLTDRFNLDPVMRTAITVGFIGSYTTFSTLTLETVRLIQDRSYVLAIANSVGSLALGLIAVAAGITLGRVL